MPLIFRAPPELRVELDILGYQFPGSHDHLDANWLMVQGRIEPVSYTHLTLPTTPYV